MIEPKWISRRAVELLHGKSLAMFGGAAGLRDSGLLDPALARPQQAFAYAEPPSLTELAASYALAICRNHPFVDGNKRAGFLAALVFLEINGYELVIADTQSTIEAIRMMESVASGDSSEAELIAWMDPRCQRTATQEQATGG